jgi:hypothetical protein
MIVAVIGVVLLSMAEGKQGKAAEYRRRVIFEFEIGSEMNDDEIRHLINLYFVLGGGLMDSCFERIGGAGG